MTPLTTLQGPVELIDGTLALRIPRALATPALVDSLRGAGQVDEVSLIVRLPESVAVDLNLKVGSMVAVDNRHGNFTVVRAGATADDWRVSSRRYAPRLTLGSWAVFAARFKHP